MFGMNSALKKAIKPKGGAFTPNGAPMGFGQPQVAKDQPENANEIYGGAPQQPQTQVDPNASGGLDPTPAPTSQPQAQAQPQNPAWNTDGYAGPAYTATRANASAMAGWDANKWQNQNHQTPKYAVGRILSQYTPSIEGLSAAAEEIAKAYPGATFNGKDKVNIPGVGEIDMLTNSGSGQNMAWNWGTGDDGIDHGGNRPVSGLMPSALQSAVMPGQGQGGGYDFSSTGASERLKALLAQLQLQRGGM